MQKTRNKPREVKVSTNPMMIAYQKMREDQGGTVTFNFEIEKYDQKTKRTYKSTVAKQVIKLGPTAIEKRSISEFLGLLTSIMQHLGATSYTL